MGALVFVVKGDSPPVDTSYFFVNYALRIAKK